MSQSDQILDPQAEGIDAENQGASRAIAGDVLPPLKPVEEAGLTNSRLRTALLVAQERRGVAQLLEMASFYSGQQEEREQRLEAKLEQLECELRDVRRERDDARLKVATAQGAKEERDRAKPVQPLLALITTTCTATGVGLIRSDYLGWGLALLILAAVSFAVSCWIAFGTSKQ